MKKASALLLALVAIAFVFVGCDSTLRDNLGTLTISAPKPVSSGLSSSAVPPDTDNLTWKYTAEKTSGFWKTGEQLTETAFTFGTSLGSFSTDGTWKFTIFAYNGDSVLVYKGSKSDVTITKNQTNSIGIDVESQLDSGKVVFGTITFTPGVAYAGTELKLVVTDGKDEVDVSYPNATIDATGKATFAFSSTTSNTLDDGSYTYVFTAQTADGLIDVASGTISFVIFKGYTVTLSGGLTAIDDTGTVIVDGNAAQVGYVQYASFEDALEAAPEGSTVKLLRDVDLTTAHAAQAADVIQLADGVTLDLDGNTITLNNFSLLFVGTDITIKNGSFVCANGGSYGLFIGDEVQSSNVLVKDLTLTGGINVYNSTNVVIENCEATGTNYHAVWAECDSTVTVKSGTYHKGAKEIIKVCTEDDSSTITVIGGTFDADPSDYVAAGHTATEVSGVWTVTVAEPD